MTDRTYRTILGALLLLALTFEIQELMYLIIAFILFEGITGFHLTKLVNRFRNQAKTDNSAEFLQKADVLISRFNMDSERVWRLLVGVLLIVSFYFEAQLWFFPWFMGFAIFGAGISGLCPALLAIRWVGFK